MNKIICIICLAAAAAFASGKHIGSWTFIFYEKARTIDGIMPQPIFNEIELRENKTALVKVRSKEMTFDIPYLIDDKYIGMKLPLRGEYEDPVLFKAEYKYSEKDGTLAISGIDSKAIYIPTKSLIPNDDIAGTWISSINNVKEIMEIKNNGLFKLHRTDMTGFYVLWKDKREKLNLTLVAGIKNAVPHTFVWQINKKDDGTMEMLPFTQSGLNKKSASVWTRLK